MKSLQLDSSNVLEYLKREDIENKLKDSYELSNQILESYKKDKDKVLGWMDLDVCANEALLSDVETITADIRENADVFLLIGVGGSNQGARAVLKALQEDGTPKIIYTGNNLSPVYMNKILQEIEGKSIYVNVIAKNFATLEPGICFRIIRNYMEKTYGEKEAAKRIITTGSPGGSSLEKLSEDKGYKFLPFPLDVGGRYSVLSAVGLLPIAVGGIDIRKLVAGAKVMRNRIYTEDIKENMAINYAVIRNLLLQKGFHIEILAYFEPLFEYFSKWWVQLFGESEGKDGNGIFPTACCFSEDLHALGQYIQEGQKIIMETFIELEDAGESLLIPKDESKDYFDYLDQKDFAYLNKTAFEATVKAHKDGGVPALIIKVPELNEFYMGQLFYFFEFACYVSGMLLGVDPFDQPGVEAYKKNMFSALGRPTN